MSDSTQPSSSGRGDDVPGAPPVPPAPPAPPSQPGDPFGGSFGGSTPPAYGSPDQAGVGYPAASAPSAPYAPAPYGGPAGPPKTLSLIGMIAGIVGLVVSVPGAGFGFIFSAAAVVLGFLGRRRETHAKGFWLTAIITGFVGIAVSLVYLVLFVLLVALVSTNPGYSTN